MFIITLYVVTDPQRRRIAELLGKKDASQDDYRAFLQQEGERND